MKRVREYLVRRPGFDDPSGVHDRHAIGHSSDDAEVVRNQDHSGPALTRDAPQQIQNLRLHRYVERGGGFIRQQQARTAGDRHGDYHALAHAA
jgi:hypothetical protein